MDHLSTGEAICQLTSLLIISHKNILRFNKKVNKAEGEKMEKDVPLDKEKILNVAGALFGERGYAATSVRDIAKGLDVSIAMIYYYFKNKEDLLFTIIESIGNDLLVILNKSIEEFSDPLERLRHMLLDHVRLALEKKNEVKVYVEEQVNLSKKYKNIIYKQHRNIYDTYIKQLEELKKLKLIHFEQLPVAAFGMFGMAKLVLPLV
jgi:AcrR family transcriptional regulator